MIPIKNAYVVVHIGNKWGKFSIIELMKIMLKCSATEAKRLLKEGAVEMTLQEKL